MNNKNIEDILDLCLEELKKGTPLKEVLAKYPDHVKELKPLLSVASRLESAPKPQPSTNAVYNALMEAGKYLPEERVYRPHFRLDWLIKPQFAFTKAIAVILIFALVGWTTVNASANALPGDLLYPVKLAAEQITFILTVKPEGKAELRLTFSEQRMQELLARYRKDGTIDAKLIREMLDEAKLALDRISSLPKETQPQFYSKVTHFNDYQKNTLQSIQPHVSGEQRKYIDSAIETCSNRGEWMQKMMKQGMYCPWDESAGCSWR